MTYKQAQITYGIQGKSTVLVWLRKHGNLNWTTHNPQPAMGSKAEEPPAQRIKRLEKLVEDEKSKNTILNGMIDIIQSIWNRIKKKVFIQSIQERQQKEKISSSKSYLKS